MQNTRLHAVKSYYDNRLGLVTLEDDVLSVVRQVKQMYRDRITVELDPVTGAYHLVEHCEDGTDRLIFTVTELDGRVVERLMGADSHSRAYRDPYDAAEREQDEAQRRIEQAHRERLRAEGERLAHALKKDGLQPHLPLTVAFPKEIPDA